jgi:predicted membrane protein
MVFEFLQGMSTTNALLIIVIFVIFIIAVKKIIGVIKNIVIIAVAAMIFPIIAQRFLGIAVPTDTNSLLGFVALGIGLYLIYIVVRVVYKLLKLGTKVAPKGGIKKEDQKILKKMIRTEKERQKVKKDKSEKDLFKDYVVIEDKQQEKQKEKKKKQAQEAG